MNEPVGNPEAKEPGGKSGEEAPAAAARGAYVAVILLGLVALALVASLTLAWLGP